MKRALGAALLFVALAAAASAVLASTTSTPTSTLKPGQYILHKKDNTVPAPFDKDGSAGRFNTIDECKKGGETAAIASGLPAGTVEYKCDSSTGLTVTITKTNTCSDEPAPKLYLTKVTNLEDGKQYWEIPGSSYSDDGNFTEIANLYVRDPKGDAAYPNCWIRGVTERAKWRVNGKDEPGKVFMQLLLPGMPTADLWPDEMEPPEKLSASAQAYMDQFNAEWDARMLAARQACIAAADKNDKTVCPPKPFDKPGACGWFWETSCDGPGLKPPEVDELMAEWEIAVGIRPAPGVPPA
jgi:hypothetical protein